MSTSENPLRKDYWAGVIDARPVALFRVALAFALLSDLANRSLDFHAFYSPTGIVPDDAFGYDWISLAQVRLLFVAAGLSYVALAVGLYTRVATLISWILLWLIQMRNPLLIDGGDTVMRLMLFWSLFTNLGADYSLDGRLRGRRQSHLPALPVRLLQWQVMAIYFFAGHEKLDGAWRSGVAVHRALHSELFVRGIGEWLGRSFPLCLFIEEYTIWFELLFAPLVLLSVLAPRLRLVAILGGVLLHGGILLSLRVGIFSTIMPATYALFLLPQWLPARAAADEPRPPRKAERLAHVVAAALMLAVLVNLTAVRALGKESTPRLTRFLMAIGLSQRWGMFAPDPPSTTAKFMAFGVTEDGLLRDLLPELVPELTDLRPTLYHRWQRARYRLLAGEPRVGRLFGKYVCSIYNADPSRPKLIRFELFGLFQRIAPPNDVPDPPSMRILLHQPCR